ncbi:MAG: hypothetical protein ACD_39C01696G0003 [uncultured bacterium]|nr:MAG: hypothetical protein ACD_39C01696G0003 [uncultured bacterium]
MGKKLFFLSLIILSVAMGMHWQKNRPKTKSGPARPRVALNLQDLQIQDQPTGDQGDQPTRDDPDNPEGKDGDSDPDKPGSEGEKKDPDKPDEDGDQGEEQTGEDKTTGENTLHEDPIIFALSNMQRNPFERSPYAQLVLDLQKKEEVSAQPVEKKSVKLLNANFSATIQTKKELVAVIDSRLYRKGELFQNKKISDIQAEIVSLESGPDTFLIPKHGVDVSIAEDGTYTVVDNFRKN